MKGTASFLRATSGVQGGPWKLEAAGETFSAGAAVGDWDYQFPVHVTRALEVDLAELVAATGHGPDAQFVGVLTWRSSGSGLGGSSERVELTEGLNHLSLKLEGEDLGGSLSVTSLVMVESPGSAPLVLAARRPGALMWQESATFHLEGTGDRLPTRALSFAESGEGPSGAAWVVHVHEGDLDELASMQVALVLNRDHPLIGEALQTGQFPDHVPAALTLEIERRLVDHALDREDLDPSAPYEEGSFGELLLAAFNRNFAGGRPMAEVRALRQLDRGVFDAEIQASTRYLA